MEPKAAKGKKRSVCCDKDAKVLLELWAERATDLRRTKRNSHIYKEISVLMDNKYSPEEVHVKIRNFKQKYRDEKKQMGPSGGSPSNWKFYDAVHRIIGSNASNNAEVLETFSFKITPDASSQSTSDTQPLPLPVSQPLPSPVSQPLPLPIMVSSPSSSLASATTSSSAATVSSFAAKKRNHLGEMVKMMKEQNDMLKSVVEESQALSTEIVNAIREQNETGKELITLMKTLIDKIKKKK